MDKKSLVNLKREKQLNVLAGVCVVLLGVLMVGMMCPMRHDGANAMDGENVAEAETTETVAEAEATVEAGEAEELETEKLPAEEELGTGMGAIDQNTTPVTETPTAVVETQSVPNDAPAMLALERAASDDYLPSTVSVALSADQITMNSDAGVTGRNSFYSGDETLTVQTSNKKGFAIYLSTAEEKSVMQNVNASLTSDVIQPVQPGATKSTFNANSWGYALSTSAITDSTPYNPVPAALETQTPVLKDTTGDQAKTYNLSFGTAIDNSLPAGQYRSTVIVSVIANPEVIAKELKDITYMQDMTTEICKNTPTPTTGSGTALGADYQKVLVDRRDNKQYRVAKLADGNCWMTENLRLSLTNGQSLTAELSDLGDVTNLGGTTYNGNYTWNPHTTNTSVTSNSDYNGIESWNLAANVSYVSGGGPSGDSGRLWYYQFNTATAGTGQYVTSDGGEAQGSICPKGWKLPLSKSTNDSKNGSFAKLLNAYGVPSNSDAKLLQAPLYFVRGGYVGSGSLSSVGSEGDYRSQVSRSNTAAYDLYFGSSRVNPSANGDRYAGYSLRCVAIGS